MDQKTGLILNLAKYGAYVAVLWVTISYSGVALTGPLLPFFFIFALDSIRSYYFDTKLPAFSVPSIYFQLLLIFLYIYLDITPLGVILLVILVAESHLTYPHPNGSYIFLISIIGFPVISAASQFSQSTFSWDNMAAVFINSLFLFFAFAFSYMARRQLDERERAENALKLLDRSRTDLEEAYHKLVDLSKEREQLAAVEERSRLARELHDTLAHTLTAIIVSLEAGKKLLNQEPLRALEEIGKSQDQARKGLDEVRLTVKALRSRDSEKIDFASAIKSLVRDYSGSGIDIRFDIDEELTLPPSMETTLYRITQESITNSIRHGDASLIKVTLQRNEKGLLLEVADDGKGSIQLTEGHGLRGIRERAAALGGQVSIINPENGGFLVRLELEDLTQ